MSPKCLLASRSEGSHQRWEIRMSVYCNTDENSRILSPFKLRLVFEAHIKWTEQRRQRQTRGAKPEVEVDSEEEDGEREQRAWETLR